MRKITTKSACFSDHPGSISVFFLLRPVPTVLGGLEESPADSSCERGFFLRPMSFSTPSEPGGSGPSSRAPPPRGVRPSRLARPGSATDFPGKISAFFRRSSRGPGRSSASPRSMVSAIRIRGVAKKHRRSGNSWRVSRWQDVPRPPKRIILCQMLHAAFRRGISDGSGSCGFFLKTLDLGTLNIG